MRIFLGLTEVAGYYGNLKRGFDSLGIDSLFVDADEHRFRYPRGRAGNVLVRMLEYFGGARNRIAERNPAWQKLLSVCYQLSRVPLLLWALFRFDVFIFGFKSSLLPGFSDLPILKFFGKRVIYVFHGSDARPPYINGAIHSLRPGGATDLVLELTGRQKRQILKIERYADVIVNHPPTSHFHERTIISWLAIGIPFAAAHPPLCGVSVNNPGMRILHSPSHPESKGTSLIREAVERLREKGHRLDLIEVVDQPNEVVLYELAQCDFVVDQVYSDTPLAGFATEAAFHGKPAVVGGYGRQCDWGVAAEMIPPSEFVHPHEIEQAIERLLVDAEYRLGLGERAAEFVKERWSPKEVAKRFVRLAEGEIPEDWCFDPDSVVYLHGYGLSEARAKQRIQQLIEVGGAQALQLTDKPTLEKAFENFAYAASKCSSDAS